ncbi:HD domain-containing protein [Chitiniphilus purpureus]|uniref:HD domain-containing protein n=1 Tax=Chitiniphilus purpureus TaxID=2981137 RepID=A0ABY6DSK4_9NEIS|nr:HD domain-containing phosphohydrolase [Chitiniphilus sp. CD1]UXY14878.1 HD domain-containing protein [Chitiniphilus sp. CD1]
MSPNTPPPPSEEADAPTAGRLVRQVRAGLAAALAATLDEDSATGFVERMGQLVEQVQNACDRHPDLAIAMTLLCQEEPYAVRHAADVAIVSELALRRLGHPATDRRSVVAAALSMNVGMIQLQDQLAKQDATPTAEQRQHIQQHPQHGRDQLRQLGVADTLWLDCVLQHHEIPDGNGYPNRLKGDSIRFEARLLGLADRYCALLTQNAWRNAQRPDSALQQTLSGDLDTKLGWLLTQTLGIYPPGAVVQLLNGEIGVVKRPGTIESTPLVTALFDAQGRQLVQRVERDTRQEDYMVTGVLDAQKVGRFFRLIEVWGEEAVGAQLDRP